ncbi:MAG: antibiotic biosynthesis monooxygenase [Actinobacteria bacterium]|nr:antibiotic biosynthesis monooxygenase [Actinomycetota bacterium]
MANENLAILFMFSVKRGTADDFIDAWNQGVGWLKNQSGWVGESLVRSHDDPNMFVSIQEWTDPDHFKNAASSSNFQDVMNNLPLKEDVTVASYSVVSKGSKRMAA